MDIRGEINAHGEAFKVKRGQDTLGVRVRGIRTHDKQAPNEKVIYLVANTDVQRGDWLQSVESGNRYYLYDTEVIVEGRR